MLFALKPPSGVLNGLLQTSLVATGGGDPIVVFGETGGSALQAELDLVRRRRRSQLGRRLRRRQRRPLAPVRRNRG